MTWIAIAVVATFFIQAVLSACIFAIPVLAPAAHGDIGVEAAAIGMFMGITFAASTAASFLTGALIARHGPMRVSQGCLLIAAAGLAAAASAHPLLVVAGAIMLGLAYGPATPASSQILVALAPVRMRATILSVKQTGVPAGGAVVGALLPLLVVARGWQAATLALAASCAVLALLCQPARARLDAARASQPAGTRGFDLLEPLRLRREYPRLREAATIGFLYSGVQMSFGTYLVLLLVEQAQLTLVAAGTAMSAFMLTGIVGRVLWGAVADRTGRGRTLLGLLGLASAASAAILATVQPGWPAMAVVAICVAAGASAICWNGVQLAEIAHHAPEGKVALATSLAMIFSYSGVVVAPLVMWGLVASTGSYAVAFGATAVLAATGGLRILLTRPAPVRHDGGA